MQRAPVPRRRAAAHGGDRAPTAALLGAGLVLGVVGGWIAGMVRARKP